MAKANFSPVSVANKQEPHPRCAAWGPCFGQAKTLAKADLPLLAKLTLLLLAAQLTSKGPDIRRGAWRR